MVLIKTHLMSEELSYIMAGLQLKVSVREECFKYIQIHKLENILQPTQADRRLKIYASDKEGSFVINIEGPQDILQQACSHVEDIVGQVRTTRFKLKFLSDITTPVLDTVSDIEQRRKCWIKYTSTRIQADASRKEPVVTAYLDKIQHTKADVIVNTTNPSLRLKIGEGVSEAISRKGGNEIEKELKQNYPNGIGYGEVAVSDPGKMKKTCKTIYHGALPKYNGHEKSQLDHCFGMLIFFMLNCLQKATTDKHKSIAFPALGTGALQYPLENVVHLLYQTVRRFLDNNPGSSLEEVTFVIYPKTRPLIRQMFVMENLSYCVQTNRVSEIQPQHREAQNPKGGRCEARLQVGNTYIQVINSSVRSVFDVTKSVLILWLRQDWEAGNRNQFLDSVDPTLFLCEEYKKYVSKLKRKKCVTDKTSLPGRTVIHSVYSTDDVQHAIKAACRGLKLATKEGLRTLTLPAVAEGNPLWKPDSSAQIIMAAIRKVRPVDMIISVAISRNQTFEPFVVKAMELTDQKLFISPETTAILNTVWDSFSLRGQGPDYVGDAVLSVTSDSDTTNREASLEFEERFKMKIVYTMTGC